jgi:hypothetical protein
MPKNSVPKSEIVSSIARIRQEWQDTGDDILDAEASVGLILLDVCDKLELTSGERAEALGDELHRLLLQVLQ